MRALIHDPAARQGLALREVPEPEPADGQALVAVQAIALNFGELAYLEQSRKPGEVPGWDAAGTVLRAAADGTGPAPGTRVVTFGWAGAWAEQRAVDVGELAAVPAAVDLGQAGCILPVAFVHRPGQVTVIYAALIAESVLGQLYQPATQALVPSLVGRNEELTSANAVMSVSNAVTRLVGASLGGVILAGLGLTAVVLIDVGSYLTSAACLCMLRWRAEGLAVVGGEG